jgi:hypothetical protein
MHVRSQASVVGKIPAGVIGIVIDHDWIGIPKPVAHIGQIKRSNAEIPVVEKEPVGSAACKAVGMAASDAAGEMTVLPGMSETEPGIVAGGVPHPLIVLVNMGRLGVPGLISEIALLLTTLLVLVEAATLLVLGGFAALLVLGGFATLLVLGRFAALLVLIDAATLLVLGGFATLLVLGGFAALLVLIEAATLLVLGGFATLLVLGGFATLLVLDIAATLLVLGGGSLMIFRAMGRNVARSTEAATLSSAVAAMLSAVCAAVFIALGVRNKGNKRNGGYACK